MMYIFLFCCFCLTCCVFYLQFALLVLDQCEQHGSIKLAVFGQAASCFT